MIPRDPATIAAWRRYSTENAARPPRVQAPPDHHHRRLRGLRAHVPRRRLPSLPQGEEVNTPTPACAGNSWPYDTLIDRAGGWQYRAALQSAKATCGGCPIQRQCFAENREEPWVRAMIDTRRPPTDRSTCGTPRGANAHYRHNETACDTCRGFEAARSRRRKAIAALAKDVQTLADIPEVIRVMHAEHVKLTARGEEIPAQIREGERTYQALRHKVRKARAAA